MVNLKIDFIYVRTASKLVPWKLLYDKTDIPAPMGDDWGEILGFFETGIWSFPFSGDMPDFKKGDRLRVRGRAIIRFLEDDYDIEWGDDVKVKVTMKIEDGKP